MFGEEKNLKDSLNRQEVTVTDSNSSSISYKKTDKLITALYMVTDIIDKDEPLRNKLRILGTEIISDMNSAPAHICAKIAEIMSFLGIASTMNIISEMNSNILKKEFLELDHSIKASSYKKEVFNKQIDLSEFFSSDLTVREPERPKGHYKSIGHQYSTRLGVQKGSTLLKALSDTKFSPLKTYDFDILKKQRRQSIIDIIKTTSDGVTIKDIKDKVQANPSKSSPLASCGEKTLQRELVSMVKDGVLNKTGEKRWSRYFFTNSSIQ